MVGLALVVGAAKGTAALSSGKVRAAQTKPSAAQRVLLRVEPARIERERAVTWRWQRVMGVRLAARPARPSTPATLRAWQRLARRAYLSYLHPPHLRQWLCIHRYEGSWSDSGDPYWGGLQMDRGFMSSYAARSLLRRGFADRWSPLEQMWVAERAYRSGRGFAAWPNTARMCGLI